MVNFSSYSLSVPMALELNKPKPKEHADVVQNDDVYQWLGIASSTGACIGFMSRKRVQND